MNGSRRVERVVWDMYPRCRSFHFASIYDKVFVKDIPKSISEAIGMMRRVTGKRSGMSS